MAYEDGSAEQQTWLRRNRWTILGLLFLLALAGVFRVGFNYGPAVNDGDYRYAGNDDYYHLRVVEQVTTEGQHLGHDPLLNYPVPAINPRPPVYDWHVAILGRLIDFATPMESLESAQYALEWGSALWGILSVIPIWLIGRTLYGNRAGLWAGFLLAASPAHIQRSGFGLGDHDAFLVFFMLLGIYFLIRATQSTRTDLPVGSWVRPSSLAAGFGAYMDTHRKGLAYAVLTGVCWATIALGWEGYPYVLAVYAVYAVLQLFFNHLRHRDSTGDVLIFAIIFGIMTLVPLPYYWELGHLGHTMMAASYIMAAIVLTIWALAFTRDLPAIVVLPSLAAIGLVTVGFLFLVVPDIAKQIFSGNGYFAQNDIYSTIAEAQRTELGVFVFSVGFMTFFLGLIGFVFALVRYFKTNARDQLFMVGWGLISIYMALAATRFVFNAAPAFAVLGGWMADKIVTWMNFRERARSFQSLRQESWAKAIRSTLGTRQVAGGIFIGLLLVAPNVWFSFDAGFPGEARANYRENHPGDEFLSKQTGAFGQGFLGRDWLNVYGWLAQQDTDKPCHERPAHMAWWDYGFWEVAIACHPTVADNFQNGIPTSGRFLAAQSEKEAIEWMTLRLIEGDWATSGNGRPTQAVLTALADYPGDLGAAVIQHSRSFNHDELQSKFANATNSTEDAARLYMRVADATGTFIGYFLTDGRMLPLDDPQTPYIESGSIFYAPVFLAERNPDDFVQTVYVGQNGQQYRVSSYEVVGEDVRQKAAPEIVGSDGRTYFASGNRIFRATEDGSRIDYAFAGGEGLPLEAVRLEFKDAFYKSMFYRGYVGGDGERPQQGNYHAEEPGQGLEHFRLVKRDGSVKLLQFYVGAPLEGTITAAGGVSLTDLQVEVQDPSGAAHKSAAVGADGRYRILMPPSAADDDGNLDSVKLVVTRGGQEVANKTFQVTWEQALRGEPVTGDGNIQVAPGSVEAFAFIDRDRNGAYNASIDAPAEGAQLSYDGQNQTADAAGKATFSQVAPGGGVLTANLDGHRRGERVASVPSGGTATVEVPLQVAPVPVTGTVKLQDGTAVADIAVNLEAKSPQTEYTQTVSGQRTDENGTFEAEVSPGGTYTVRVDATREEEGGSFRYQGAVEITVDIGSDPVAVAVTVTRSAA